MLLNEEYWEEVVHQWPHDRKKINDWRYHRGKRNGTPWSNAEAVSGGIFCQEEEGRRVLMGRVGRFSLSLPDESHTQCIFTRYCLFRLSLIPIKDTWSGWASAIPFLWRCQKMGRLLDSLNNHVVFLMWNSYAARKMEVSSGYRWTIHSVTCLWLFS